MRNVLNDHSRFEELCALDMVDQLTQQERLELLTHCSSCPDCEAWLSEAHTISAQLLISRQVSTKPEALPVGADVRFAAEAHRRGIPLPYVHGPVYTSPMKLAAVAVILVALGMVTGISIHKETPSVTQEAAARREATPENLLERSTLSSSSTIPTHSNRALPRRRTPRRAKHEARPALQVQDSLTAAWPQRHETFQMRSVSFDFGSCCKLVPQRPAAGLQSLDLRALRTFPRFGGVLPLAASPERVFRYEAALLPVTSSFTPAQPHSFAFRPQVAPFYFNLEHTR